MTQVCTIGERQIHYFAPKTLENAGFYGVFEPTLNEDGSVTHEPTSDAFTNFDTVFQWCKDNKRDFTEVYEAANAYE